MQTQTQFINCHAMTAVILQGKPVADRYSISLPDKASRLMFLKKCKQVFGEKMIYGEYCKDIYLKQNICVFYTDKLIKVVVPQGKSAEFNQMIVNFQQETGLKLNNN